MVEDGGPVGVTEVVPVACGLGVAKKDEGSGCDVSVSSTSCSSV